MDELITEFLAESRENLDRLDQELVKLESNPTSSELLSSIFRTIHTIKGTCGFLGFNKLEKVAHAGENLLSRLRDGKLTLNAEMTSGLLAMVDAVRQMLGEIQATGKDGEADYSEVMHRLTRLQQSSVDASAPAAKEKLPKKAAKSVPPEGVGRVSESRPAEPLAPPPAAEEPVAAVPPKPSQGKATEAAPPESRARDTEAETIRVGVTLLDKLMTLVGELVLARNQLVQFSNSIGDAGFQAISQRMNLIATELQEEVMKTRMQPIGNIWSKFPRTVRDVALNCGKDVRIEMEGKDTELDKTIIEAIKDPLTHLVRNAVDHGIETPEARTRAGKDRTGRLTLRAFHEGGQVNIEISDDGAGLDVERIRKKAVERGLIAAEHAARMQDRDIFNLIFLPGLSTAEKVTNVSGRGVGMDVVRTNVERIGGTVGVQSAPGRGTTVRVKIPLTLAIIPALIVTCGGNRFAIPQVALTELVSPDAHEAIEMVHGAPVYRLRGRLLPLVYLKQTLGATPSAGDSPDLPTTTRGDLPDFYQARDKHYQWLGRLRQVLDNKASIAIEQAGSHTECALGRWLHGDGLKGYTDIAELHSLEEAHRHFHGLVHDVVVSKVNGNQRQAEQAFGRVAEASLKVIELLTTVERRTIELRNINIVVLQAGDRQFGLVVDGIHDTEEIVVKPLRKQLKSIKTFAGASIMGDGRVALILDVMGLAQRAGVIAELKEKLAGESAEQLQQAAGGKQRFLLFAGPGESRMAVPLETVARLEELPRAQVEKTGQQWVTQYRGKILPLVNLALVLEERRRKPRPAESAADFRDGPLQMLVCNHQGATAGIVVEKILDIVEDAAQVQHPASRAGVLYSAVIAGHVTELLDVPAILAAAGVSIEPEMSAAEATQ